MGGRKCLEEALGAKQVNMVLMTHHHIEALVRLVADPGSPVPSSHQGQLSGLLIQARQDTASPRWR